MWQTYGCLELPLLIFYQKSLFWEFQLYLLKVCLLRNQNGDGISRRTWIRFLWMDSNSNPTCPLNPKPWRERKIQNPQDLRWDQRVGVSVNSNPKDSHEVPAPLGKVDAGAGGGWDFQRSFIFNPVPPLAADFEMLELFLSPLRQAHKPRADQYALWIFSCNPSHHGQIFCLWSKWNFLSSRILSL